MKLIEQIRNDDITEGLSLGPPWHRVETARMSARSSVWFKDIPIDPYEFVLNLRDQLCRHCQLWSGSDGNFTWDNNKHSIIIRDSLCTGVFLHINALIPFRNEWYLLASAPVGTFSRPDLRARCTK